MAKQKNRRWVQTDEDWVCGNCEADIDQDTFDWDNLYYRNQGTFDGVTGISCCSLECYEAIEYYFEEYLIKNNLIKYDDDAEQWYWVRKQENFPIKARHMTMIINVLDQCKDNVTYELTNKVEHCLRILRNKYQSLIKKALNSEKLQ